MKRTISTVLQLLSLALVAGAYAVHYFAAHRIGMVRWVNYHTQNIRAILPIDTVKYLLLVLLIIATVVLVVRINRNKKQVSNMYLTCGLAIGITALYAVIVFTVTHDISKADVFVTLMVGLAAILQVFNLAFVDKTLSASNSIQSK